MARWVLPTPGGPWKMTLRPSSRKRSVASSSINGGLEGEAKVGEALLPGQPGEGQAGLDDTLAAGADLSLPEPAEEGGVTPVVGGGLLGERVELGMGGSGADLQQAVGGELFVQGALRQPPHRRSEGAPAPPARR